VTLFSSDEFSFPLDARSAVPGTIVGSPNASWLVPALATLAASAASASTSATISNASRLPNGPKPVDVFAAHFASDGSDCKAESDWYATYAATAPLVKSPALISLRSEINVVTATTITTVESVAALKAHSLKSKTKTKRRNAYAKHAAANAYANVVAPSKHAACRDAFVSPLVAAASHRSFVSYAVPSSTMICTSRNAAPPTRATWKYASLSASGAKNARTMEPIHAGTLTAHEPLCTRACLHELVSGESHISTARVRKNIAVPRLTRVTTSWSHDALFDSPQPRRPGTTLDVTATRSRRIQDASRETKKRNRYARLCEAASSPGRDAEQHGIAISLEGASASAAALSVRRKRLLAHFLASAGARWNPRRRARRFTNHDKTRKETLEREHCQDDGLFWVCFLK